jgi:GMP synthase-like glutamine amidotransferase
MILIISLCKEKLHYFEFVKPLEDILKKNDLEYFTKDYWDISKEDLEKSKKIIISGTSLSDNVFAKNTDKFKWILNFNKPILGICGGMQIIGAVFGGKIKQQTEIGFYSEEFEKAFLGFSGRGEFYHLHNHSVDFSKIKDFEVYCENQKVTQAVKHKEKEIYGVLFHPEVRKKSLIVNFCLLNIYC